MEGHILAEFSHLNALSQKAPAGYDATPRDPYATQKDRAGSSSARGPPGGGGAASNQALLEAEAYAHKERLFRGEVSYTAGSGDGKHNEHSIEDQPQSAQFGISHLLPKVATTEERERLLRRLEMCAKAREESTKIMSVRFAQRDAVKNENRRERQQYVEKLTGWQRDRDERWSRKLQRSPFAVDLVAENQRIDEENRVKDHIEQRRQRLMARRNREAHNAIFKRATAETDELDQLRAEKRMLLENERQLKALRDVERSNARTAQILQQRRNQQMAKTAQAEASGFHQPWPQSARSA